jgi:hypothetical protein
MIFTLPTVFTNEYTRLRILGHHVGVRRVCRVKQMIQPVWSLHGEEATLTGKDLLCEIVQHRDTKTLFRIAWARGCSCKACTTFVTADVAWFGLGGLGNDALHQYMTFNTWTSRFHEGTSCHTSNLPCEANIGRTLFFGTNFVTVRITSIPILYVIKHRILCSRENTYYFRCFSRFSTTTHRGAMFHYTTMARQSECQRTNIHCKRIACATLHCV